MCRYNAAITSFITEHAEGPFFLYVPFNHVHTAASNQPDYQFSGCRFRGASPRGGFGDAVMEMDWLVGVRFHHFTLTTTCTRIHPLPPPLLLPNTPAPTPSYPSSSVDAEIYLRIMHEVCAMGCAVLCCVASEH